MDFIACMLILQISRRKMFRRIIGPFFRYFYFSVLLKEKEPPSDRQIQAMMILKGYIGCIGCTNKKYTSVFLYFLHALSQSLRASGDFDWWSTSYAPWMLTTSHPQRKVEPFLILEQMLGRRRGRFVKYLENGNLFSSIYLDKFTVLFAIEDTYQFFRGEKSKHHLLKFSCNTAFSMKPVLWRVLCGTVWNAPYQLQSAILGLAEAGVSAGGIRV